MKLVAVKVWKQPRPSLSFHVFQKSKLDQARVERDQSFCSLSLHTIWRLAANRSLGQIEEPAVALLHDLSFRG